MTTTNTTHAISVRWVPNNHGYPYRAFCACGWQSNTYAATHAAQAMGDDHVAHAPADEPDCVCGHAAVEHHYSPSGCGTSHCEHDADDMTGVGNCAARCREYMPNDDTNGA